MIKNPFKSSQSLTTTTTNSSLSGTILDNEYMRRLYGLHMTTHGSGGGGGLANSLASMVGAQAARDNEWTFNVQKIDNGYVIEVSGVSPRRRMFAVDLEEVGKVITSMCVADKLK